ncbi:MAG: hypothetical protein JJU05_07080 [Verrucomicrobia bacterium]|nr:hypothetical protein [Verrucomicrobiota bacterium]MCH8526060.1 glycoside hydrolase family 55 protein [Kiritimatiellia bacterium]
MKYLILIPFVFACLFTVSATPPDAQWDEVRGFYEARGIPRLYLDQWRPFTRPRSERVEGLHVLPEVSLTPFEGVTLDAELAALGKVSVVDFGADPTGETDATGAIQRAVDFARDHAMVCFFPPGTYTVSGTVKAWSLLRVGGEWQNGRITREDFYVPVLVGSGAGEARPVIRLAPGTFPVHDENDRRFVVEFRNIAPPPQDARETFEDYTGITRFRHEMVPHRRRPRDRERLREARPDHIGPEFRGIDIEIAENNAGASGISFPTAETSGLGDVSIRFLDDGHVGLQSPPGGGSATLNLTVTGGRIGIDTTGTQFETNRFPNNINGAQPTPVLTGVTLIGQTELALRSQVRGALVGVGWHIETDRNGPLVQLRHHWYGDPFSSSFALIDSTVVYNTPDPGNVFIGRDQPQEDQNRSFILENVYLKNAAHVYRSYYLPAETFAANPEGWHHVRRLAYERKPRGRGGLELRERVWIDGAVHDTWYARAASLPDGETPPADLQSRHLFDGTFPHFEVPGAVNIRDHGAVGDLVADDTEAIRAAIAAAAENGSNVVIIPRGTFKISDTIDLLPDTKLIGINRQWSVITSSQADGVFGGFERRSDLPDGLPLVRTADTAEADTVIAHLRLAAGFPVAPHNNWRTPGVSGPDFSREDAIPLEDALLEVYPLLWRSGGSSIVRECMFDPRRQFNFFFGLYDEETYEGAVIPHPLVRIEGHGGGRWYGFHFHGYEPFGPEAQLIRITENKSPVHFYHLHAQHNTARELILLDRARHVSIYGIKTEHHKVLLRSVGSEHVRIFGHGGIATPMPGGVHYAFEDTANFLIAAMGDQVRFGGDASHGSGWSIMYFTNLENYLPFTDRQGDELFHPPSTERPILWLRGDPEF